MVIDVALTSSLMYEAYHGRARATSFVSLMLSARLTTLLIAE